MFYFYFIILFSIFQNAKIKNNIKKLYAILNVIQNILNKNKYYI